MKDLKWSISKFYLQNYDNTKDNLFTLDVLFSQEKDIIILEGVDKKNPKNIQRVADTAAFCDTFKIGFVINYSDGDETVIFPRDETPRGYISVDVVFSDEKGYECELWKYPKDSIETCIYRCCGKKLDKEGIAYYNMLKAESYKPKEYIL